jgi:4-hydroxybenzoate polyprenyltransferase
MAPGSTTTDFTGKKYVVMKTIWAYLVLFRWPNLLLIAITQALYWFAIVIPAIPDNRPTSLNGFLFFALVMGTIFMCAASNAINDYYDTRADLINKPHKQVVGKWLSPKQAWDAFIILNIAGVGLSVLVAVRLNMPVIIAVFAISSVLLWLYSFRLKQWPLIGNVYVALMSTLAIGIIWIAEYIGGLRQGFPDQVMERITFVALAYGLFTFFSFLSREILKDIEDVTGDEMAGCKTLPIVAGVKTTKHVTHVVNALFFLCTLAFQVLQWNLGKTALMMYIFFLVQMPLLLVTWKIIRAENKQDYTAIQSVMKLIMVSGLVSLLMV